MAKHDRKYSRVGAVGGAVVGGLIGLVLGAWLSTGYWGYFPDIGLIYMLLASFPLAGAAAFACVGYAIGRDVDDWR